MMQSDEKEYEHVLLSWGCDGHGRHGRGTLDQHSAQPLPTLLPGGAEITALACGAAHCIASLATTLSSSSSLVESNDAPLCEIYTWGKCHTGQLGHGDEDVDQKLPKIVHSLDRLQVDFVAAGTSHSILVVAMGSRTYTWGFGFHGCLGHGLEKHEVKPRVVEALEGRGVVSADGGNAHSVLVLRDGTVVGMGKGAEGQLGGTEGYTLPTAVYALGHSTTVATGANHTMIIQADGKLIGCGANTVGQLGLGHLVPCHTPSVIETGGRLARSVACGNLHSVVLLKDSHGTSAWACGSNARGQLGIGTTTQRCSKSYSVLVPMLLPSNAVVVDVACGEYHTAIVLGEAPHVLTCGCSDYGKLGRTVDNIQLIGTPDENLQILAKVADISATIDDFPTPYEKKKLQRKAMVCTLFQAMSAMGECEYTLEELFAKSSEEVDEIRKASESEPELSAVKGICEALRDSEHVSDAGSFLATSLAAGSNHTMLIVKIPVSSYGKKLQGGSICVQ